MQTSHNNINNINYIRENNQITPQSSPDTNNFVIPFTHFYDLPCIICLEDVNISDPGSNTIYLKSIGFDCNCNKSYHISCLDNWLGKNTIPSCPTCRTPIQLPHSYRLNELASNYFNRQRIYNINRFRQHHHNYNLDTILPSTRFNNLHNQYNNNNNIPQISPQRSPQRSPRSGRICCNIFYNIKTFFTRQITTKIFCFCFILFLIIVIIIPSTYLLSRL